MLGYLCRAVEDRPPRVALTPSTADKTQAISDIEELQIETPERAGRKHTHRCYVFAPPRDTVLLRPLHITGLSFHPASPTTLRTWLLIL